MTRYLGLDLGTKTLGVAISDKNNIIATTYKTINYPDEDYTSLIELLKPIIESNAIDVIVLGYPKNMNNTVGPRARATESFKECLEHTLGLKVIFQDERLTTVMATNFLLEANISRKKRKRVVDSLAANIILQNYLDMVNQKGF